MPFNEGFLKDIQCHERHLTFVATCRSYKINPRIRAVSLVITDSYSTSNFTPGFVWAHIDAHTQLLPARLFLLQRPGKLRH